MNEGGRSDLMGRIIGMLVFLLGVVLLIVVFYIAYGFYNLPPAAALGLNITGDPKKDPAAITIGARFGLILLRIIYLAVMSVAGSLIANKGVYLYFSATQGAPLNMPSKSTVSPPAA